MLARSRSHLLMSFLSCVSYNNGWSWAYRPIQRDKHVNMSNFALYDDIRIRQSSAKSPKQIHKNCPGFDTICLRPTKRYWSATIDTRRKTIIALTSWIFGRPFVKRFAVCYRSVVLHVCLSVCLRLGVLWPNGWTDQDETWRADRFQPWPHCLRCEPDPTPRKGHSRQFSAHISCGQMARWIQMPLDRKIGLDPSDIVLDGDPAPPLQKSGRAHPNFRPCLLCPNGGMDQDAIWHGASTQATLC